MNLAILWLMKTCTFPMENMKQGAQSLWMKMQNAELNLKGVTDSYLCSVKVRKTKLLPLVLLRAQKRISEQALN